MHLGRTKAEMITLNVLGPMTVRDILNDLSPTEGEPVFYSVATDASNKGNRKIVSSVRETYIVLVKKNV